MTSKPPLRVALAQIHCPWADPRGNLERMAGWAEQAKSGGAQLVVFPELCVSGICKDERLASVTETLDGPSAAFVQDLALRLGLAVGFGFSEKADGKPCNAYAVAEPDGTLAGVYRKIHLFDVAVDAGPVVTESARVSAGDRQVVADIDGVRLGLTICYDVRFPELYRALALAGAHVLAVPANFTERTGRDHWEVLLRARAIENGAYVLAPSQIGGPPDQPAFGRTMIVDPWGTVLAQAPDEVTIVTAEIDTDRVDAVRRQIPALANRRPETY